MKTIVAVAALIVLSGCAGQQITAFEADDAVRAKEACKELEGKKKPAVPYEACYTSSMLDYAQQRGETPTATDQYIMAYRANLARQIDDKQITREQANLQIQQEVVKISQQVAYQNQARNAAIGNAISQYGYRQQQHYQGLASQPQPNYMSKSVNCTTTYNQPFRSYNTNCY